jgi:hypothetical protein
MNIHGIQSVGTLTQEAGGFATLSGSFTGSFKGDGSQLTNLPITPTDTGSLVTTASFNAYTASQDDINSNVADSASLYNAKWDDLGAASGSWVNVPLDSLNAFTASQDTKNSTLATYTASVDTKFSNIGSQSGSWITESETASFARTNVDNNFSVGQTITGDVNVIGILTATEIHTIIESSSVIYSSGSNILGDELSDVQTLSGSVRVQGSLTVNGTPVQTSSVDISALNAFTASQETKDSTLATYTASVDNSISSLNSFTASNGIASLNAYTASNDTKWSNLGGQTGSFATTGSNNFTGNQKILGQSPQLTLAGNENNSGSQYPGATLILATDTYPNDIYGGITIATEQGFLAGQTFLGVVANSYSPQYGGTPTPMIVANGNNPGGNDTSIAWTPDGEANHWKKSNFKYGVDVTGSLNVQSTFTASLQEGYAWVGGVGNVSTLVATSSFGSTVDLSSLNAFTASQETKDSTLATYTASVNSSLTNINTFTASILGTNPWTASIDTKFATLGTQSGSWGGGGAFPYTGSAQITGSLGITGSVSGKVNPLVVTGTTASLDFSIGNMFTLTLPSASTTYFNPANIKAGQTINVQLTQQTPGTGSVSFAPSIKFAGGNDYQATATGSAIDLITFVSLDGTNVLATSIKNFL